MGSKPFLVLEFEFCCPKGLSLRPGLPAPAPGELYSSARVVHRYITPVLVCWVEIAVFLMPAINLCFVLCDVLLLNHMVNILVKTYSAYW